MKNTHVVYHLHDNTDTPDGYVGVTKALRNRLYRHRQSGLFQEHTKLDILLIGSEKACLDLERQLRPTPKIGWNTYAGGFNKFPKGHQGGVQVKRGQRLSPETEFKKGMTPYNAGVTRYKLTNPQGEVFIVDNLTEFCREHGLTRENIRKVAKGQRKHAKQWLAQFV